MPLNRGFFEVIYIFTIRAVKDEDYLAILDIYSYYVAETSVSFEYDVPTKEELKARVKAISSRYPYIVAEEDGKVIGYAYASDPYNERAACRWDSDVSVYVDSTCHGKGVGKALYAKLEEMLKTLGFVTVYALITEENENSCRFHEKAGYEKVAFLPKTGLKFGKWHGIYFYGKVIGDFEDKKEFPKTTQDINVYEIL